MKLVHDKKNELEMMRVQNQDLKEKSKELSEKISQTKKQLDLAKISLEQHQYLEREQLKSLEETKINTYLASDNLI